MAFIFLKLITFRWPKCHFCVEAKPCPCELAQVPLGTVATSPAGHLPAAAIQAPAPWPTPVQTTELCSEKGNWSEAGNTNNFQELELALCTPLPPWKGGQIAGGSSSHQVKVSAVLRPKQQQNRLLQALLHPSARAASEGRHL